MTKQSFKQIQDALLEQYKVWRRGDVKGAEMGPSGGLGSGGDIYGLGGRGGSPMQIDIGLGGAGKGTTAGKPKVSAPVAQQTPAQLKAQELIKGQGFKQAQTVEPQIKKDVELNLQPVQIQRSKDRADVEKIQAQQRQLQQQNREVKTEPKPESPEAEPPKSTKKTEPTMSDTPVTNVGRKEPTMSDTPVTNVGRKEPTLEQSKKQIDQSKTIENNLSEKYHGFKLHEAANVTKQDLLTMAKSAADRHGVPLPVVLHALYKETGWMKNAGAQVTARSPAGALGVMQLMPGTAKYLGLKPEEIFDPEKNIDAGVRYLSQNLQKFSDPRVALAAYNAGPNSKRVKQFAATGDTKYLPRETRKYVSDYADDTKVQLAKFYPEKKSVGKATDVVAALTASPTATAAEHPIGTIVNPDYSKYNVGDLGPLEKIGPGQYRSSTGKIVSNAPELEKLPGSSKPETFLDKVKRTLPQELGGGGELVSKVFGGDKKPTPVAKVEPAKTEPAKTEPVKVQQPQINVRKEFEKEFAKQRAALGSGGTFAWTNPLTGKTSEFTTAYKDEKPTQGQIVKPVEKPEDKPVEKSAVKEPDKDNIDYKATADRDRISKLVNQPTPTTDTNIKSSDADSKKFTPSQEKWLGGADPTDPYILDRMNRSLPDEPAVEIPKLKEAKATINTELQDILRLAGRI